jgi:soluble lytic murein transglycosylase-like protein
MVPTAMAYTVRSGDSFSAISARFGTTPTALAKANGRTLKSVLHVGDRLKVPGVLVPNRIPGALPPDLRSPERLALIPLFLDAAQRYAVPYDVLMAQAYRESSWKSTALSVDNARGIGQLLPATASWVARVLLHDLTLNPANTADNIKLQARFLRYLIDLTGGDLQRALAGYYQGHFALLKGGMSATGKAYAASILARRLQFRF